MTVSGLSAGDVIYVYENGQAENYTRVSHACPGRPDCSGGCAGCPGRRHVGLQVKRTGQLISDVYTVDTPAFAEPTANQHAI